MRLIEVGIYQRNYRFAIYILIFVSNSLRVVAFVGGAERDRTAGLIRARRLLIN